MHKNALFSLKNRKNRRALGAPPPDLFASGGWVLHPQSSRSAPHDEIWATCLGV